MKRTSLLLLALSLSAASLFCDNRHIAFERDQAVWIANLDRTSEKKIADGIFPAISPDGTRIAFNTTEKTSDTTYGRHCPRSGRSIFNCKRRPGSHQKSCLAGTASGSTTTTSFFSVAPPAKRKIRFIEWPPTEKSQALDQERAFLVR
jgi:hypothetical protein